jgi:putative SOS response-associated peptidase YedK
LQNGEPFAFAGLWEHWEKGEDESIETCTIITTEANELMSPIHNRMPVIIDAQNYEQWLDPKTGKTELLKPYSTEKMICYPVSTQVNSPKNDRPECIQPI